MALTKRDLLRVQAANPNCRVELRDGKIIVMSPSGLYSESVVANLLASLHQFVRERKLGFVVGSSGGFHLPNGDIVGPDVSFVSRLRGQGTRVTLLIDPDERTVVLERAGGERRVLGDADSIELPSIVPGWSMRVSELWPEPL